MTKNNKAQLIDSQLVGLYCHTKFLNDPPSVKRHYYPSHYAA